MYLLRQIVLHLLHQPRLHHHLPHHLVFLLEKFSIPKDLLVLALAETAQTLSIAVVTSYIATVKKIGHTRWKNKQHLGSNIRRTLEKQDLGILLIQIQTLFQMKIRLFVLIYARLAQSSYL
jgi:hypothetical protein